MGDRMGQDLARAGFTKNKKGYMKPDDNYLITSTSSFFGHLVKLVSPPLLAKQVDQNRLIHNPNLLKTKRTQEKAYYCLSKTYMG